MNARSVVDLIQFFERHRLDVCIDGGWAVDAVLGRQTRHHDDLDIALPHRNVPTLRQLLSEKDFVERHRDDTWECNFVLVDNQGRELDVHSYTLDEFGNNIQGVPYIAEQLIGTGVIRGHRVRCVPPEWLVRFHTGYDIDEKDFQDVMALCEQFDIDLPKDYLRFLSGHRY